MWVSGEARGSQAETQAGPRALMLLRIWHGLRGAHTAPARADLDLRQLPRLVPWLFIAEPKTGTSSLTWRLAGTGIGQFFGREVTGGDFLAGWEHFERGVMAKALGAVTGRHHTALLRLRYLTDRGQQRDAEMLALPMLARDSETTHVLGGFFPQEEPEPGHHDRLVPSDVAAARVFEPAGLSAPGEAQARRKFQVISGGLDEG